MCVCVCVVVQYDAALSWSNKDGEIRIVALCHAVGAVSHPIGKCSARGSTAAIPADNAEGDYRVGSPS